MDIHGCRPSRRDNRGCPAFYDNGGTVDAFMARQQVAVKYGGFPECPLKKYRGFIPFGLIDSALFWRSRGEAGFIDDAEA